MMSFDDAGAARDLNQVYPNLLNHLRTWGGVVHSRNEDDPKINFVDSCRFESFFPRSLLRFGIKSLDLI